MHVSVCVCLGFGLHKWFALHPALQVCRQIEGRGAVRTATHQKHGCMAGKNKINSLFEFFDLSVQVVAWSTKINLFHHPVDLCVGLIETEAIN